MVLLEIWQNVFKKNFIKQETLAQLLSCEFCQISKNTFLHRPPLVAASDCFAISNFTIASLLRYATATLSYYVS